jgi:hypothetical protein
VAGACNAAGNIAAATRSPFATFGASCISASNAASTAVGSGPTPGSAATFGNSVVRWVANQVGSGSPTVSAGCSGSKINPTNPCVAAKVRSAWISATVNGDCLSIVDAQPSPWNTHTCAAGSATPSPRSALTAMLASRKVSRDLRGAFSMKRDQVTTPPGLRCDQKSVTASTV